MNKRLIVSALVLMILALNNSSYLFAATPAEVQKIKKQQTLTIDREKGLSVLAVSRNDIQSSKNKKGDAFSAKLVEDIKSEDTVVIPSGSIFKGFIIQVDSPQRFPCRDGAVYVAMSELELSDGKIVNISESKIKTIIYSPYRKGIKKRMIESFPVQVCYYGLMLPLSVTTDIAEPVISCIATGGALVAGTISGYMLPDKGRSRTTSAVNRGIDATPVGTAKLVFSKGESADLKSGDGLIITFDAKTIQKILEKRNMQIKVIEEKHSGFLGDIF